MSQNLPIQTDSPKHGGGPATAAGKEISKMNALKSGLYSSQMLIKTEFYSEDEESFRMRESELREQFCPEGGLEEMYIQKILFHHQGLIRTNAYEVGCLTTQLRQWASDAKNELISLQKEIDQKEKELETSRKRLEQLTHNQQPDSKSITTSETEYLANIAKRALRIRGEDCSSDLEDTSEVLAVLTVDLDWDEKSICSALITHSKEVIANMPSQLSTLRLALQATIELLPERMNSGYQQLLLVDSDVFARIERSRSSHSKHLQRAIDMLMRLQAFRIQKKRFGGAPLQVAESPN